MKQCATYNKVDNLACQFVSAICSGNRWSRSKVPGTATIAQSSGQSTRHDIHTFASRFRRIIEHFAPAGCSGRLRVFGTAGVLWEFRGVEVSWCREGA